MSNSQTKEELQREYDNLKKEYEEFAYIVSHDLKAPLRAISNLSGWISEDLGNELDSEVKHNIQLLQNRTERMEKMINAILLFSRVERRDLAVKTVNVQALVRETSEGLGIPHELQTENLPTFTTYSQKLETVFQHLLQNAVQFNQQTKPLVKVMCRQQDSFYHFTVQDNGIGISPDAHDKVFKLFYTVQPKDQTNHLGAGLTLVRKIVQFVGGQISLSSEAGKGSQFTFTWPTTTPAL